MRMTAPMSHDRLSSLVGRYMSLPSPTVEGQKKGGNTWVWVITVIPDCDQFDPTSKSKPGPAHITYRPLAYLQHHVRSRFYNELVEPVNLRMDHQTLHRDGETGSGMYVFYAMSDLLCFVWIFAQSKGMPVYEGMKLFLNVRVVPCGNPGFKIWVNGRECGISLAFLAGTPSLSLNNIQGMVKETGQKALFCLAWARNVLAFDVGENASVSKVPFHDGCKFVALWVLLFWDSFFLVEAIWLILHSLRPYIKILDHSRVLASMFVHVNTECKMLSSLIAVNTWAFGWIGNWDLGYLIDGQLLSGRKSFKKDFTKSQRINLILKIYLLAFSHTWFFCSLRG